MGLSITSSQNDKFFCLVLIGHWNRVLQQVRMINAFALFWLVIEIDFDEYSFPASFLTIGLSLIEKVGSYLWQGVQFA